MEQFFNNAWIIGIGGGVISGFIVFMVTSKIFSKRENKEYQQKIRLANNELLYAIRPLVVEQKLPTIDIFNSVLLSTSKKYSVNPSDLYNRSDIADDLTKEVMDNSFLTSENKLKYCELTEKIKELSSDKIDNNKDKTEIIYIEKDKSISKEYLSLVMSLMTAMMAVVASLFVFKDKSLMTIEKSFLNEKFDYFSIIAVFTTIPVIAIVMIKLLEMLRTVEKRRKTDSKETVKIEIPEKEEA
ncbi:hypothetical protein GO730_05765 [Spirosoma sp. HMF3257]|uniref:Uncharacterized protein n=1 Tax=Spirosoma telluris TaxID=2183553 RepID=A0A327NGQ7_9BACT|nr:hypothetical protein [Spirosoma telluris]RAI73983.1 hypothetical protein HMF3257_05725 [Spirosoma telluris]